MAMCMSKHIYLKTVIVISGILACPVDTYVSLFMLVDITKKSLKRIRVVQTYTSDLVMMTSYQLLVTFDQQDETNGIQQNLWK